jgi:hypothetical protein
MKKNKEQVNEFRMKDGRLFLCCGKARCPSISKKDDMIFITDDFGGKVKIPHDQAKLIDKALKILDL